MQLRYYQTECVAALWDYFAKHDGNPVVSLPTGTGKSLILADFIRSAMLQYPQTKVIALTHVRELVSQNHSKLLEAWPTAPAGIYSAGLGRRELAPIIFGGIASVAKRAAEIGWRDLAFVDECHLVSHKENTMYRQLIAALLKINPKMKTIGLSATCFRLGLGHLTEGGLFTHVAYDNTKLDDFNRLISEGYLAPLVPKRTGAELDITGVSIQGGEFNQKELEAAVDKEAVTYYALRELVDYGRAENRRSWLIFATGIHHTDHVAAMLREHFSVSAHAIHSKIETAERDYYIRAFKAGQIQCLVNSNVLTTGFDHPWIDLVGVLRPTNSPVLWCLDSKTKVLTSNGWATHAEIQRDTQLASLNSKGEMAFVKPLGKIKRPVKKGEYFVRIKSNGVDIKVTNKHDMLVQTRHTRKRIWTGWKKVCAETLTTIHNNFRIPVSGKGTKSDLDLSDAELRFLGLFMTDGTLDKTNNQITIYQTERYPKALQFIEQCLRDCGFKFGMGRYERPPYSPIRRYRVAFGKPRKTDLHLTGWGRLANWIDKNFPLALMNLSERQFDLLLEAINVGDGVKQPKNVSWTQRSFHICTGNKIFVERLQQSAVMNGYSANVVTTNNPPRCSLSPNLDYKPKPKYMLRLKKRTHRSINTARSVRLERARKNEFVWCVQNENGSIVIQRNGKVAIVGNCQMLGRATRPAPGKRDALILDFARNTKRLGPINDPVMPKKRGKGGVRGEAPVKVCPVCDTYNHTSVRFCTKCGAEFERSIGYDQSAGSLELIRKSNDVPQVEIFKVDRVTYSRHKKRDRPDALKVSYFCNLNLFNEYVLLEHEHYALHRAHEWWRLRSPVEPPGTIDLALHHTSNLIVPTHLRVWVNKVKHPEILDYAFEGVFQNGNESAAESV